MKVKRNSQLLSVLSVRIVVLNEQSRQTVEVLLVGEKEVLGGRGILRLKSIECQILFVLDATRTNRQRIRLVSGQCWRSRPLKFGRMESRDRQEQYSAR